MYELAYVLRVAYLLIVQVSALRQQWGIYDECGQAIELYR